MSEMFVPRPAFDVGMEQARSVPGYAPHDPPRVWSEAEIRRMIREELSNSRLNGGDISALGEMAARLAT